MQAPRRAKQAAAILTLLVAGFCAPIHTLAASQPPPPGSGTPPPQPSGQAPADSPQAHSDALAAAVALAHEAAGLVALHAFPSGQDVNALSAAIQPVAATSSDRGVLQSQVTDADSAGARLLPTLAGEISGGVGFEVNQTLATLSSGDWAQIRAGKTISISPRLYLASLDDLLSRDGRPAAGAIPNPSQVATKLSAALAAQPATAAPTPAPTPAATPAPATVAPASSSPVTTTPAASHVFPAIYLPLIGAAIFLLIGLAVGLLYRRRRLPRKAQDAGEMVPSVMVDRLMEVSRRLTMITAADEIERAIVREAVGGALADAGALVVRRGDDLVIAHSTREGLLDAARLGEGAVGQVAATGQVVQEAASNDPALRETPRALMVVPLTNAGSVEAVLVLLRSETDPFTAELQRRITALAPVAAAALQSARATTAALEESRVDPLTGVGNRRRLEADLSEILGKADGRPTAVIMLDLDHFKRVNDDHGHAAGDRVLRDAAQVMRRAVRPADAVYRYGGEEFCVICPDTGSAEAVEIASRIREAIAAHSFDIGDVILSRTASLGVAATRDTDVRDLIRKADAALYEAKESGRNRVHAAAVPGAR